MWYLDFRLPPCPNNIVVNAPSKTDQNHLCCCSSYSGDGAAFFSCKNYECWCYYPFAWLWWTSYPNCRSAWFTLLFLWEVARPKLVSSLMFKSIQDWILNNSPAEVPHFDTRFETHQDGRKSVGHASGSLGDSKEKGGCGDNVPDVLQSTTSWPSSSLVVWVGTLTLLLYQWKSINSNRFVLNTVKGHHLRPRYHPSLLHNFKWFKH